MAATESAYLRRNFLLGVLTGTFVNVGIAFFDPATVLPAFVSQLGGSAVLIGFVSALHGVGWFFPQVFASRLAETRQRLIYMYRAAASVRIAAFIGVMVIAFAIDPTHRVLFLGVFVVLLLVAHIAGGFAAIPFLEIISKTIPVTSRGRFFAMRRLIGGIFGIGAGVAVGLILNGGSQSMLIGERWLRLLEGPASALGLTGHEFPQDFAIIFFLGAIFMALGMLTFFFAGEDPSPNAKSSSGFVTHLKSGIAVLRDNADYRRFYLVRICWQFTAMAFPFYVSFAYDKLGLPVNLVGLFLATWIGAGVFSNYAWGWMLDRFGNRVVLFVSALLSIFPPVMILVIQRLFDTGRFVHGEQTMILLVLATFLLNGAARSGRVISHITYPLEFAPETKRPLYVGIINSATFPFMLSPLLGGVIIEVFDMSALFAISFIFALLNAGLSLWLREPRWADR